MPFIVATCQQLELVVDRLWDFHIILIRENIHTEISSPLPYFKMLRHNFLICAVFVGFGGHHGSLKSVEMKNKIINRISARAGQIETNEV